MNGFTWALLAFDAVGFTAGVLLLWWLGARGKTWRDDVRVLIWFGAALALAAVLSGRAIRWHQGFAVICFVAHALFCVGAPLLVVRGAWHVVRGARPFGALLLAIGLAADGVWLYATQVEPTWLEVTRYEVRSPRLPPDTEIRIVVLADLQTDHIGDYERRVFEIMDAERADLILLPGDYLQMFDRTSAEMERERRALVALFNGLEHAPRYGIWGVDGDVDDAKRTFEGSIARPILDAIEILPGDPPLQLVGLSTGASRMPLTPNQRARIEAFAGVSIVMGHAPDFALPWIEELANGGDVSLPALGIAGHTHGGQVRIPGFGPLMTLSAVPRRYATGMHRLGNATLFVSRGVGHERGYAPRIRLFCRPELAVITLFGE